VAVVTNTITRFDDDEIDPDRERRQRQAAGESEPGRESRVPRAALRRRLVAG
jgi:hypothetical protein